MEKIFYFLTHDNRVVPLGEKHALVLGFENRGNFKEYLGMLETNDPRMLEKNEAEIRAMNLPRIKPRECRKTIFIKGQKFNYRNIQNVLSREFSL